MRWVFFADNEPIDLPRLPPVAGTVLAKRLVNYIRPPTFPAVKLALASVPALAGLAAIHHFSGIYSWGFVNKFVVVLASTVPFILVFVGYLRTGFLSKTVQWPPLSSQFPTWDALSEALRNSPHSVASRGEQVRESDHLFLGLIAGNSKPCLLHTVYANRPALIFGRTASGKTKLIAEPLLVQLVLRRYLHVLVIDLKGDKAFMLGLAGAARRAQVDFKWLTLARGQSSYVWNFLLDPAFRLLGGEQFLQILLKALSIVTGQEHGAGYFGAMQEERARRTLQGRQFRSFRELYEAMRAQRAGDVQMEERDFSNTGHLVVNLARISSADVLNAAPGDGTPEAALRGAISLLDVLSKPGVTYFSLPAQLEPTTALFVSKLLVHLLAAVAKVYDGRRVPVVVWQDEAQEALGPDLTTPIRQARESEISYWFGLQDMGALQTSQGDLLSAMLGNTPLKIFCTAEDPAGQEYIKQNSGETTRPLQSVSTSSTETIIRGRTNTTDSSAQQLREEAVMRIDQETINRVNRDPNAFFVMASESKGFTRYRFPVVVRATFPVTARTLARRMATPWPRGNRYTVTVGANLAEAALAPPAPDGPPEGGPQGAGVPGDVPPPPSPAPAAAAGPPPRRRGRPRRVRAEAAPSGGTPEGLAPASEMAEYLRRLAEEPPAGSAEGER